MRTILVAVAIALSAPLAVSGAQSVRQERAELRRAERAVDRDQRDRRQAARQGDTASVRQESREIRAGQRDVREERREVQRAVVQRRRGG